MRLQSAKRKQNGYINISNFGKQRERRLNALNPKPIDILFSGYRCYGAAALCGTLGNQDL
jgi:hypothetical protein